MAALLTLKLFRHPILCTSRQYSSTLSGLSLTTCSFKAAILRKCNHKNLLTNFNICPQSNRSICNQDDNRFVFYDLKNNYRSAKVSLSSFELTNCRRLHTTTALLQKQALSRDVRKDVKFSEKAKEATKTTYYALVVLAGLGIIGVLAYAIFGELFASFSTQRVYSDAVDKCKCHPRVQDLLGGDSIKCYGEESRRGRRQHISHMKYVMEGQKGMRISFHLKGTRRTATAQLDARDSSSGWYYRYLYVQMDHYPHQVVVLEDNRAYTGEETPYADAPAGASPNLELSPIFPPSKL